MDQSSNIQSSKTRPGKIAPAHIQQAKILEIVRRVAAKPDGRSLPGYAGAAKIV